MISSYLLGGDIVSVDAISRVKSAEKEAELLVEEAKKVYPQKGLNSLNTVGYKELFEFFDKKCSLDFAIEKIKQHSRIYSRKQMTWFKRDKTIHWFHPDQKEEISLLLKTKL